jgi:hypothetical protein
MNGRGAGVRWLVLAFLAILSWGLPSAAWAQEAEEEEEEEESLGVIITGRVQKPEVNVVIGRDNLNKGFTIQLTESFLDRIKQSVTRPPF